MTVPRTLPTSEAEWVYVVAKDSPLGEAVTVASFVARLTKIGLAPFGEKTPTFPDLAEKFA